MFLSSYRNMSGSLGEREMLWEHEPQASVSTASSSTPKLSPTGNIATPPDGMLVHRSLPPSISLGFPDSDPARARTQTSQSRVQHANTWPPRSSKHADKVDLSGPVFCSCSKVFTSTQIRYHCLHSCQTLIKAPNRKK